jgi:hypothetical protein
MGFFDQIDVDDYITDFNELVADAGEDPGVLAADYLPVPDDVGGLFDIGGADGGADYGEWGGDWDTAAQELFGGGGLFGAGDDDSSGGGLGGIFDEIEDISDTLPPIPDVTDPGLGSVLDEWGNWPSESFAPIDSEPIDWGTLVDEDPYDFGNCWTTDCWDYDPLPYTICDCGFEDEGWYGTDLTYEQLLDTDPSIADPFLATTVDVLTDDTVSIDDLVDVTPGIIEDTIAQTIDDTPDVDDMITMAQDDVTAVRADDLPDIEDDLVPQDLITMPAVELSDVATEDLADAAASALSESLTSLSESLDAPGDDVTAVGLEERVDDAPLFAEDEEAESSFTGNAFPPDETLDQP